MNTDYDQQENNFKEDVSRSSQENYLINYRNGLWEAVRHKENGIWQFISFYSAALILVIGFILRSESIDFNHIRLLVILIVLLLVSFWGLMIVLDANFWLSRNLWIISNIELNFLGDKPKEESIIPKSYKSPEYKFHTLYSIHTNYLFALITLIILSGYIYLLFFSTEDPFSKYVASSIVGSIFSFCFLYLISEENNKYEEYEDLREQAQAGRNNQKNELIIKPKYMLNSPIRNWGSILAALNLSASIFILLLVLNKNLSQSNIVDKFLLSYVVYVVFIFTFRYLLSKNVNGDKVTDRSEKLVPGHILGLVINSFGSFPKTVFILSIINFAVITFVLCFMSCINV